MLKKTILNKCHEGAILVCVLFSKNNYRMTAKAREESIIYAIPIAVFRPFVANAAVLNFLLETFATNKPSNKDNENSRGVFQTPYFIRINNLKCNIFRLYLIIPTKN
jgi:CBS domain-containing protein